MMEWTGRTQGVIDEALVKSTREPYTELEAYSRVAKRGGDVMPPRERTTRVVGRSLTMSPDGGISSFALVHDHLPGRDGRVVRLGRRVGPVGARW